MSAISGPVDSAPLMAFSPLHPPEAAHAEALADDQVRLAVALCSTVSGATSSVIVGAAAGGGVGTGGGVTGAVGADDPPPPQPTKKRKESAAAAVAHSRGRI